MTANRSITTPMPQLFILLLLLLSGCGGSQTQTITPDEEVINTDFPSGTEVPDNRYVDSYNILVFGNSHVRSHNLSDLIRQLIVAGRPGTQVNVVVAAGGAFLDERLNNDEGLRLLQSKNWSHVILQGQKYSISGLETYPVDATLLWIKASKAQQATPVLFPEHRQLSIFDEGIRVHQLHQSIVALESSCLAPVGLAWDRALRGNPTLELHERDGNHATLAGAFLTALVFYQSITGNNADMLPTIQSIAVPASLQQTLRQVAAATLQQYPACPF